MSVQPIDIRVSRLEGAFSQVNERLGILDRHLSSTRTALDTKIENVRESLDAKIDANIDSLRSSLEAKIENARERLDAKIDVKVDGLRGSLTARIDGLQWRTTALIVGTWVTTMIMLLVHR